MLEKRLDHKNWSAEVAKHAEYCFLGVPGELCVHRSRDVDHAASAST